MGDAFCLKWNNHQTTLVSVFDKLFECESLVDCTLAAEGRQLKAHKVVLSACSPYLEELIKNHEDKHPIIIFNSISYEELKAMLEYMYRGEVNVSQEQLESFLKVAESLKIKGLTDQGGGFKNSDKDERTVKKRKRRASSESTQSEEKIQVKPEPKCEPVEEANAEMIEDLTNEEEDEEYGPPGPGTSQGSFSSQDFNHWQVSSDMTSDEVFMAAQQEINSQGNPSQDFIRPFSCTSCGKSYLRRKHLSRHVNQECGLNRGRYQCQVCSKSYSRKEHLYRHHLFQHSMNIPPRKVGRPRKSPPEGLSCILVSDADFPDT